MDLSGVLFNRSDARLQNEEHGNETSDRFWHCFQSVEACLREIRQKSDNLNTSHDRRVRIAVLDSGINLKHSRIQTLIRQTALWNPNRVVSKSFTGLEDDFDPVGHGTHIGGTIMSMARGAKVYIGGVVDSEGQLNTDALNEALNHAIDEWDVDIISLSLGFPKIPSKDLMDTINRVLYKEKLIFAAVSNNGGAVPRAISWPAMETKVFGIFSANFEGERSKFNPDENDDDAFSRYKFLGEAVKSAWLDDEEKHMTGTSVATSVAASTAALFLEYIRGHMNGSHGISSAAIRAIERVARRPDGMRRIFAKVGIERQVNDFLRYVTPWYLLDQDKKRFIMHRIDEALVVLQLDNYDEEFQNLEASNSELEGSLLDQELQVQGNQISFDDGRNELRIQVLGVLSVAAIGNSSAHFLAPFLLWVTGTISLALVWRSLAFARDKQGVILNDYKKKATDLNSELQDSKRLNDQYILTGDQTMAELLALLERIINPCMLNDDGEKLSKEQFDGMNARFEQLQLVSIEDNEVQEALAASQESRAVFLMTEIGKLILEDKKCTLGSSDEEEHRANLEKAKIVLQKAIASCEKLKDTSQHFDDIQTDLTAQEERAESDLAEKTAKESGNIAAWLWWFLVWLGVGVSIIIGLVATLS